MQKAIYHTIPEIKAVNPASSQDVFLFDCYNSGFAPVVYGP